jgi:hypothetical protein
VRIALGMTCRFGFAAFQGWDQEIALRMIRNRKHSVEADLT